MILVGQSQRLAVPLTRRQRRAMVACGVVLLAAAIAAGILSVTTGSGYPVSRDGCVSVLVAGSTGGQLLRQCGAPARALCKTEYVRHDRFALEVQAQCRLADIKPGHQGSSSLARSSKG
jgi:hypothetical protein